MPPKVVRAAITSRPRTGGDTYYRKETIQATLTFSEAVKVTGTTTATLRFEGDNPSRNAAYRGGSGTRKLVFAYRVQAGDRDANGVTIGVNALARGGDPSGGVQGGGTIKSVAGAVDASLASAGVEDVAGHMVDGSVDSLPALESARVGTNKVYLNFDEDLTFGQTDRLVAAQASSAFMVKVNGQTRSISFAVIPASNRARVEVWLGSGVQYGDVVTVSYAPPATNPLQDAGGNRVLAFADVMVRNVAAPPASVPPAPAAAEVAGNTVALDFDEDLDGDSTPATSAFTVKVNGRTRTTLSVGVTRNPDDEVTVNFSGTVVQHGDEVTVSYAPPAASPLQDDDGNRVVAFTDFAVQNLAPLPPALESARVGTNKVYLTFDEDLTFGQTDRLVAAQANSAFTVKVNGRTRSISFAVIPASNRARVEVWLGSGVQYGDVVTVSYAPPATNALQDAGGNRVLAFADVMVRNVAAPPASAPRRSKAPGWAATRFI